MERPVEMGRVAGAYGVQGWLRVQYYGVTPDTLIAASKWHVGADEFEVTATRVHSGSLLARLAGVETREAAQRLRGRTVVLPRDALPEARDGRIYWDDLVGLEVVNGQGARLGVIRRVTSNGAHEVIELGGDRERLLPWVPSVVRRVDLGAGRVEVDWQADW